MPASLGLGGTAPLFTFIWRPIPHHHCGDDDDDQYKSKVLAFCVSQIARRGIGGNLGIIIIRFDFSPEHVARSNQFKKFDDKQIYVDMVSWFCKFKAE